MSRFKKLLTIILTVSLVVAGFGMSSIFAEIGPAGSEAGGTVTTGFADIGFQKVSGFTTVITDVAGAEHSFNGIIITEGLEGKASFDSISSYRILKNGEVVLEVGVRDVTPDYNGGANGKKADGAEAITGSGDNAYYAINFFPEGDEGHPYEAFLTGLKQSQLESMQNTIIQKLLTGNPITLSGFDVIDAEKDNLSPDANNRSDALLCWAAAASNVLHYTGWAAKATYNGANLNLNSEDDVFDVFMNNFTDQGGSSAYGYQWFFNGDYWPQNNASYGDDWSKFNGSYTYGTFTGFLPDYGCTGLRKEITVSGVGDLNEAFMYLKKGYGEELSINLHYKDRDDFGGHALTFWGYVVDNSVDKSNPAHYKKVFITNSDSSAGSNHNRRARPDNMKINDIAYVNGEWQMVGYNDYYKKTVIRDFDLLAPYSDSIAAETTGTKNIFNNIDFAFCNTKLSKTKPASVPFSCGGTTLSCDEFTSAEGQSAIYFTPVVNGHRAASSYTATNLTVNVDLYKDGVKQGNTYSDSVQINWTSSWSSYYTFSTINLVQKFGTLAPGKYKLVATVRSTDTEAYYNNNSETTEFTVCDTNAKFNVQKNGSTLSIQACTGKDQPAAIAGYNSAGKMIFSKYIEFAGSVSSFDISGAGDVATVKLFPLDSNYAPDGEVQIWNAA